MARALDAGGKAFYTTPLKALSNQKYADLVRRHGSRTGGAADRGQRHQRRRTRGRHDHRGAAQHDLRLVAGPDRAALRRPGRGPLPPERLPRPGWEEVIIHAPPEVDLVCLSATVSNAEELADWIRTVRGATEAVIEERRPVALHDLYLLGDAGSSGCCCCRPSSTAGPTRRRRPSTPRPSAARGDGPHRRGRPLHPPAGRSPSSCWRSSDMLPAIYFIFSRAGVRRRRRASARGRASG